jgi:hypothetical protein
MRFGVTQSWIYAKTNNPSSYKEPMSDVQWSLPGIGILNIQLKNVGAVIILSHFLITPLCKEYMGFLTPTHKIGTIYINFWYCS